MIGHVMNSLINVQWADYGYAECSSVRSAVATLRNEVDYDDDFDRFPQEMYVSPKDDMALPTGEVEGGTSLNSAATHQVSV